MKSDHWAALIAGAGATTGYAALRTWVRRSRLRRLRGQHVIVVGGTRGLGLAIARQLASMRCHVAICGRDPESLERARESVLSSGAADVMAEPCDATDEPAITSFVERAHARWGRIDAITVAATISVGPIEALTASDFETAMSSIFFSAVYPSLAVVPILRAQKSGSIVHVASIGGKVAIPHLVPYSSAKFALVGFSEGLRAELAQNGIHVTTICPGLMRTGSQIHAKLKGNVAAEYAWFGLGVTTRFASIDAERAAREILIALANHDEERVLGAAAIALERFHALSPWSAHKLLALANRLLPSARATDLQTKHEGAEIERAAPDNGAVASIAKLGHADTIRFNQR